MAEEKSKRERNLESAVRILSGTTLGLFGAGIGDILIQEANKHPYTYRISGDSAMVFISEHPDLTHYLSLFVPLAIGMYLGNKLCKLL